jgi:hypothetical protein
MTNSTKKDLCFRIAAVDNSVIFEARRISCGLLTNVQQLPLSTVEPR